MDGNLYNRRGIGLLIAAMVTVLLCYQIGSVVFHHAFLTSDEGSYLFQAHTFLEGRISRDAPPFGRTVQHQMVIQDIDVGWLSRYPPLHSLWLVPGAAIDNPYVVSAYSAGVSLILIALTAVRLGGYVGPVVVLLICSPYFILMHGTLLSHTSGLICTALMLWGYISWLLRRNNWWLVVAGGAWALIFMGRPYTAFLLAIPFGIRSLFELNRNRDRQTFAATIIFMCSSFSGVIGLLIYNFLAVGDPFTMTFFYYDPTEGLGFGLRHTLGEPTNHTPMRGIQVLLDNLQSLDTWLLGWRGSFAALLMLVIIGWRSRITPLLLGGIFILPLGYLFFWYEGIQVAGPVYYFEAIPFLMVGAGLGMQRIYTRLGQMVLRPQYVAAGVGVMLVIGAVHHLYSAYQDLGPEFEQRRLLRRVIDSAPPRSIVMVPTWPEQLFLMLNPRGLESDPIVIRRYPHDWIGFVKLFSERTLYRLMRGETPHLKKGFVKKSFAMDLPTGGTFLYETGELVQGGDGRWIAADAKKHAPGIIGQGWLTWLYPGSFMLSFKGTIDQGLGQQDAGVRIEVVEYGSDIVLLKEEIAMSDGRQPAAFCITVEEPVLIEPRIYFTGTADVQFGGLRLEEMPGDC